MSYSSCVYPDDELAGKIPNPDQQEKRKAELQQWFSFFREYCHEEGDFEADYDQEILDRINRNYWEEMCESVRVRLQPSEYKPVRADRHKIASLMELLINHYKPFQCDDEEIKVDLNARAAFYIATNIIGNWGKVDGDDLYVSDSFDREHRTWLKQLNEHSEGLPIFSNAATWYLVEKLFIERNQGAPSSAENPH